MEARLYEPGTTPEHTTASWYAGRARAPHLEEGLHRGRLLITGRLVNGAIRQHGLLSVSDMGCGDGGLLSLVVGARCWGYDLQQTNVDGGAERGVDVRYGDFVDGNVEWGDLTVCTECLEHLVDPHGFLRRIPSRVVVASSPVTETAESHYPYHTWAWDQAGYRALFERAGFAVRRHVLEGMFQIVLGVRP